MLREFNMVDVKQAIAKAKEFAQDILGQSDVLLEEVSSDPDSFSVTLSIPRWAGKTENLLEIRNPLSRNYAAEREFKEFRVLKSDGSVTRMSIREVA
jgi:hypothetical protein